MQAAVPLCCAKGIFEHYAGATDRVSSGLELSEVADQFAQIVRVRAAVVSEAVETS